MVGILGKMRVWFKLAFSCHQEKVRFIQEKVWFRQGESVREPLLLLAKHMTAEEMASIIEDAVNVDDLETVKHCLEVFPHRSSLRLAEALSLALTKKSEDMILLLLQYKVDWSQPGVFWKTPILHTAVCYRRLDVIKKLVELGVNPEACPKWVGHTLWQATKYDDAQYVQLIVDAGIRNGNSNHIGATALRYAMERNKISTVRELLKMKIDIDAKDHYGETPLELACASSAEILQIVLKYAIENKVSLITKPKLLERAAGASYLNSQRNVELLLNEGLPANLQTTNGRYPIEAAIREHNDEALRILLQQGADIRVTTIDGKKILHSAVEFGSISAVRLILEKTLDINEKDSDGNTALKIAFINDGKERMELLLKNGAILYPLGDKTQYISRDRLPQLTISLFIQHLARETKGDESKEDIQILKEYYPNTYDDYQRACREWELMNEIYFTSSITYRQLVEKPIESLLRESRSFWFRQNEKKRHELKFPIYNKIISQAINKLVEKRTIWEKEEVELEIDTENRIPSLIVENIAYHLSLL